MPFLHVENQRPLTTAHVVFNVYLRLRGTRLHRMIWQSSCLHTLFVKDTPKAQRRPKA